MEDIVLYEKYGYEIRLLERHHGKQLFKLMIEKRLNSDINSSMYAMDRYVMKTEMSKAILDKNMNTVGIFKGEKLLGLCINRVEEKNILLEYFIIENELRRTRAGAVLLNYVLNHLYKDFDVRLGKLVLDSFEKLIIPNQRMLPFNSFFPDVKERVLKVCRENI